jgi:hypothetical protein
MTVTALSIDLFSAISSVEGLMSSKSPLIYVISICSLKPKSRQILHFCDSSLNDTNPPALNALSDQIQSDNNLLILDFFTCTRAVQPKSSNYRTTITLRTPPFHNPSPTESRWPFKSLPRRPRR